MNPDPSKLRQQQHQAEQSAERFVHNQGQAQHEFESVDAMIRYDAEHTPPPQAIAERLKESIAQEPPLAPRSWWQRLLRIGPGSG